MMTVSQKFFRVCWIIYFFVTICGATENNTNTISRKNSTDMLSNITTTNDVENNNTTVVSGKNVSTSILSSTTNITSTTNNRSSSNPNNNHNLHNHRTGEWDYEYRKKIYVMNGCANASTYYPTQACRAYLNMSSFGPNHTWHGHSHTWADRIPRELRTVQDKKDTSDFILNSMLRILHFDRRHPTLPQNIRDDFVSTVLEFKYWYDEPGKDTMCYWSENHQILFATAELLAGQLFPDTIFTNSGMTGQEHVLKAIPRVNKWLDHRFRFGFSEWHSNRYFDDDIPALLNLIDFVEGNELLVARATMVMDVLVFDLATNYFKGSYVTAHGRTYRGSLGINLQKIRDTIQHAAWILLGVGDASGYTPYSATFVATSDRYEVPPILQKIADKSKSGIVHKQRDGINIDDAPVYGIPYGKSNTDDVMFWWGMEAYFAPKIIQGSFMLLNELSVWKHKFWYLQQLFWPLVYYSPLLQFGASVVEDISAGLALESASTYTYRTQYYQLSGVQEYKAGYFSGQVVPWMAALDGAAYILTTSPGFRKDNIFKAGGEWTGGFLPRVTMHENIAVIQYKRPYTNFLSPILDRFLFDDYSHAYFPSKHFDEVIETGNWVIARKDLSYVALWSQTKAYWDDYEHESDTYGRELIADSKENVWVIELGDRDSSGEFQEFVVRIAAANISVATAVNGKRAQDVVEIVEYNSPSQGLVSVGWEGPLIVAGEEIDLGPYVRWDNEYAYQEFNSRHLVISHEDEHLELDFENGKRRHGIDDPN